MSTDVRRPTLKDVAALANVSIKSVSRVVNEEPFVSQDVKAKVHAAVRTLGYRGNAAARSLKGERRTATIGLVVADVANPFFSAFTRAVENAALAEGHLLMTVSSDEDPRREREIVDRLVQRRIDGLLIASARGDHRFLKREIEHGMAIVFFDRPAVRLAADAVLLDNEQGARDAVDYLLAEGHRRVALLSDLSDTRFTARQRLAGYRSALDSAGVDFDDRIVRFDLQDPHITRDTVVEMCAASNPPTAFFATNNRTAVGAAEALADRPDIGLVGFDDFELAAALRRPVTVISYDIADMANQATELLFERLAGRRSKPEQRVIPTSLIIRET